MCIIFFYQSELCQPDGYKLVLANNRDEYWHRPTSVADFWGPENSCISGRDETQQKEGGTWLAINKNGRLAILLNILGILDPSKHGRGHLVCDFVSGTEDMTSYAQKILDDRHLYNGFSLLLFDLGKEEDSLTAKPIYVNHVLNYPPCIPMRDLPANTFFGASNSPIEYSWQKVVKGRSRFGQIVSQFPSRTSKEHLIKNLTELMQDQTPLLPDPCLEGVARNCGFSPTRLQQHSAINVWSPQDLYGTRTTTIILVDGTGQVDFIERNLNFNPDDKYLTEMPPVSTVRKQFSLVHS